jgi:galactonate dehydratase
MKITSCKTYKFSVPVAGQAIDPNTGHRMSSTSKTWLFLKLETDVGIDGWGEGTGEWLVPSVDATLQAWRPLLIDQDPLQPEALCEDIMNRLPWKGGSVFGTAIAAINMALYDITGKAWGVPVTTILGGKRRDKIRVYDNGGLSFNSPEEASQTAEAAKAQGYNAVKGNPLETRDWPMDHKAVEHSVACVQAVREALGPHIDILLDTHGSPTPELSIEFARRVAPYRPLFLEEPVKFGSVDALMELSRKSPVPIATGEKLFTVREFKELIDCRACAFLQPDLNHCFGISTLVEIAKMANHQQMLMAPHNASGPLCTAATLIADGVMNNFLLQESSSHYINMFHKYVDHDMVVEESHIRLSDRPGLGVEVKEADVAKAPYEDMAYRQYRHADGGWKGW